ncbi:hypothetical protein ACFX13_012655 [Malus domestica]
MTEDKEGRAMDELGSRFGSNLKLSEKERGCLSIERKDVECALLGFQYSMVAKVLTSKEVKGDVFIDCFMSLWRGRKGVSIRDIGDRRFLVASLDYVISRGCLKRTNLGPTKMIL